MKTDKSTFKKSALNEKLTNIIAQKLTKQRIVNFLRNTLGFLLIAQCWHFAIIDPACRDEFIRLIDNIYIFVVPKIDKSKKDE